MSDFDPIPDDEQPQEVAEKPVRDTTDTDIAWLRGLWICDPQRYRKIVKERGLEPNDIWPTKAQLPAGHNMQRFPAGAFGHTLPEFDGKERKK
jgi:hypothetical protein